MDLYRLLVKESVSLGSVKQQWMEVMNTDSKAAIKYFLQLIIDLSQHQYTITNEELEIGDGGSMSEMFKNLVDRVENAYVSFLLPLFVH